MISAFGVEHGISKALKPQHVEAMERVLANPTAHPGQREYAKGKLQLDAMQFGANRSFKSAAGAKGPTRQWRLATRYDRINNKRRRKLGTNTPFRQGGHVQDTRKRVLP